MLKPRIPLQIDDIGIQPPSGGCVLKQQKFAPKKKNLHPAAFRRLCVETLLPSAIAQVLSPAAFRRLCVETIAPCSATTSCLTSRLQAAVC